MRRFVLLALLTACATDTATPGTDSGLPGDTGPGTDTSTDTAEDTGGDTGTDTGTDTGSDTGSDTGTDTGSDTGTDTGGDTGTDTGGEDTAVEARLADRLLIDLPFDGTLADQSVNAWPIDASTAIELFSDDHHGDPGKALAEDGCVNLPDVPFDGTRGGFGFSAWIRPTTTLDSAVSNRSFIAGQGWGVLSLDYNSGHYYLELYSDSPRNVYWGNLDAEEPAGTWVHLAVSSAGDGSDAQIWRNGVLQSFTGAAAPSLESSTNMFYFACTPYFVPIPADLDDVKVWERALTQDDVDALYAR